MIMEKLSMCRVCLVENVRMYVVINKNLQEIYEKLTDVPLVTEDSRPMLACFFCYTKLKQCCQLQRKCQEAEKLFAQMLNEDYETKPQLNLGQLEFSGYIISPTELISISDEYQTESVIKEEIPDVCERQDDENQSELDHECQDIKNEYNIPTYYFESENIPAQRSGSDSEGDIFFMKMKTEVEEEQKVTTTKRKANDTKWVPATKRTKIDIRRKKPEDTITTQQKIIEQPHPKITKSSDNNSINNTAVDTNCRYNSSKGIDSDDINIDRRLSFKEKPYNCEIFQNSFTQKYISTTHIRGHTGENHYKCDICQRSFSQKSYLTKHIRRHTGEKPYNCEICQRTFTEKYYLTKHIRKHTGVKPYKCDLCQRSFILKAYLTTHIRVHTGEKPYNCQLCQRSFAQKCHLSQHIRVHTGEKPYKCDICQQSFSESGTLSKHIRVHTGEKPYKCDICQRRFILKSCLTTHIRVHTGEKPYNCQICQRSFAQKYNLTQHIRVHTGEKPYKCDVCQKSFTRKDQLNKHILIHYIEYA